MARDPATGEDPVITDYWFYHYVHNGHCSLCGNSGRIDTRSVTTATGHPCGRMNYCICPNGQIIRHHEEGGK